MARPAKQTVDYFPHMATSGKTLFIIESRWGNDGYAFFFKLLELLCATSGHVIDYGNPVQREFLLAKTRVNEETATGILSFLAEAGKIDFDLWGKGLIWYQSLVENVKDAYKKRINELPIKPVVSTENNAVTVFPTVETSQNEQSGYGNGESILNNIKLKNIYSSSQMLLAEKLRDLMLINNPNAKIPNSLDSWANNIRLMVEADNRKENDIEKVIEWCQSDNFWKSNILSVKKLREKYDTLFLQMKRPQQQQKPLTGLDYLKSLQGGKQ